MTTGLKMKKFIVAVLIFVMVFPTAFLVQPKPAEAQAGVLGCLFSAMGILGSINSVVGSIMSVPVHDSAVSSNTNRAASEAEKGNLVTCVLNGLVWTLVNTMIQNFTASVVDWINSGFEGSPAFVTDPEGFFMDVGDQVAGQWIEELGPVGQVLCSPFDLNIRIALGLGYRGSRYAKEIHCRLTDVQKNVYNAFVKGDQWGNEGWANWISISQPSNNAYGVYLEGSSDLARKINKKLGLKQQELSWGRGFMSARKCIASTPDGKGCAQYDNINTPGAVIEDQLNNALGASERRLEIADSVNEIMDALINQAVGQIFKAGGGLLGMSRPSSYSSGKSYVAGLVTTYENQLASTSTLPPEGIDCNSTYRLDTKLNADGTVAKDATSGLTIYNVEILKPGHWQMNSNNSGYFFDNNGSRVCLANTTTDQNMQCLVSEVAQYNGAELTTTKDPDVYESQIKKGCSNLAVQNQANNQVQGWLAQNGGDINQPGNTSPTQKQTAKNVLNGTGVSVSQTSIYAPGVTMANKAVDSAKSAYSTLGPGDGNCRWSLDQIKRAERDTPMHNAAITGPKGAWEVTFPKTNVTEVKVYPLDFPCSNQYAVGNVTATLYSGGNIAGSPLTTNLISTGSFIAPDGNGTSGPFYYKIPATAFGGTSNGLEATKLMIQANSTPYSGDGGATNLLALEEVEVWGTDATNETSGGGSTVVQTQSSAQITSRSFPNHDIFPGFSLENPITLSSYENIRPIHVNINLEKIEGTATSSKDLNTVFAGLSIERALELNQTNPEILRTSSEPVGQIISADLPQTGTLTTNQYLKIKLSTKTGATLGDNYGTYIMNVRITESMTGYLIGNQSHTFTIKRPF